MKKLIILVMVVLGVMLQGCKTLDAIKQVPEQNVKSFTNDIESITLNVSMKDGTVYYVDTINSIESKEFILWKQNEDKQTSIGTLDIINFGLTGQKKPYLVPTNSGITINK